MWQNTEIHCGIYKIENLINHHKYIGQSINIYERQKNHIRASRVDKDNYPIHRAIKKYGIENFSFEIIEELPKDQKILDERECYQIDYYKTLIEGYNVSFGGNTNGQTGSRLIKDKQIILNIRQRKLNGENYSDVLKDFQDISENVFKSIQQGRTYSEILPEDYSLEKIEQAKKISKRNISAARKNSQMTEELVLQIRTDKKNGMKRSEGYQKYAQYFKSLGGFDSIQYNQRQKDVQP